MNLLPILLIFLMPAKIAKADILLEIFKGNYYTPMNQPLLQQPEEENYARYGEDHGLDNGEHYSWDNLYLQDYYYTEVIIDPYGASLDY